MLALAVPAFQVGVLIADTIAVLAGMLLTITERHFDAAMGAKWEWAERERDIRRAYRDHAVLAELIAAGDGPGAESFLRRHMDAAGELLLRDLGGTSVVDLLG